MRTLCISALLLSMAAPFTFAEDAPRKSNLPKVLIIGDSISLGYTPFVKEKLGGKAEVLHHRGNAGPTIRGLVQINQWLGDTQWEVIHFNWGLWDMYGWEYAKEERSPAVYEQRLETLVRRLERTEARLIWGTTTPACPEPEVTMKRRFNSEVTIRLATEQQYLDAALRVMNKHNVQVNDLHALILPLLKKYALAPNNVHFTNEGYRKLGSQVADAIQENLGSEQSDGEATSETVPSAPVGQVSPPVPSESRDRWGHLSYFHSVTAGAGSRTTRGSVRECLCGSETGNSYREGVYGFLIFIPPDPRKGHVLPSKAGQATTLA